MPCKPLNTLWLHRSLLLSTDRHRVGDWHCVKSGPRAAVLCWVTWLLVVMFPVTVMMDILKMHNYFAYA